VPQRSLRLPRRVVAIAPMERGNEHQNSNRDVATMGQTMPEMSALLAQICGAGACSANQSARGVALASALAHSVMVRVSEPAITAKAGKDGCSLQRNKGLKGVSSPS
jgi:hypothetical protein